MEYTTKEMKRDSKRAMGEYRHRKLMAVLDRLRKREKAISVLFTAGSMLSTNAIA